MLSKCVFHRTEQRANGGPLNLIVEVLGRQRWTKSTDRAQRVDEKN